MSAGNASAQGLRALRAKQRMLRLFMLHLENQHFVDELMLLTMAGEHEVLEALVTAVSPHCAAPCASRSRLALLLRVCACAEWAPRMLASFAVSRGSFVRLCAQRESRDAAELTAAHVCLLLCLL